MKNIYSLLRGNGLLLIAILILSALLALDGIVSPYFIGRLTNDVFSLSYSEMNSHSIMGSIAFISITYSACFRFLYRETKNKNQSIFKTSSA